jgi:UDP-N-acetylmuramoyl-tripeptide--D-alanyl-D-alanine ligase
VRGLESFVAVRGRSQAKRFARAGVDVMLIDDTYNANPDSVRAAIDVLATCPAPTVLVLGDMGEVGDQGSEFHREVGAYARQRKIGSLFALGEATRHAVEAFGGGGRHFDSVESLVAAIQGRCILVKGSRFMKMERVVAALTGSATGGH